MVTSSTEASSPLLALSNTLAAAVEHASQSVVTVHARHRQSSSGVYWQDGIVVTADHTIDRDDNITIGLPDGRTLPATIGGRDAGTDLAVLRVEGANLPPADIAAGDDLKVGHLVVAVARPGQSGLSASMGALSAVGPSWRTWSGGTIDRLVRPDLTLYPGFSGGPLINASGQVVGINTSGLSRSMPLAVPVATIGRVTEQLVNRGRVARGYLGLGMQPVRLPDTLKTSLDLSSDTGLIVMSVEGGGPSERAGILVGDILVAIGGTALNNSEDVQAALDPERVGTSIEITVVRGGALTKVLVTVGERPRQGE